MCFSQEKLSISCRSDMRNWFMAGNYLLFFVCFLSLSFHLSPPLPTSPCLSCLLSQIDRDSQGTERTKPSGQCVFPNTRRPAHTCLVSSTASFQESGRYTIIQHIQCVQTSAKDRGTLSSLIHLLIQFDSFTLLCLHNPVPPTAA